LIASSAIAASPTPQNPGHIMLTAAVVRGLDRQPEGLAGGIVGG